MSRREILRNFYEDKVCSTEAGLPELFSLVSKAPVERELLSSTMVAVKAALGPGEKGQMLRN
jgi:hypothetical protein